MSRVGRKPINLPQGVSAEISAAEITIKGPKGVLSQRIVEGITIEQEDNVIYVKRASDAKNHRSLHGLTRALVANMVQGVSAGFEKKLELVGVGYRASMQGQKLVIAIGYSHPVEVDPPEGIEFETPAPTRIVIRGISKELVGNTAAHIRAVRKPEPYKGKGIKYENETIRRKAGKSGGR